MSMKIATKLIVVMVLFTVIFAIFSAVASADIPKPPGPPDPTLKATPTPTGGGGSSGGGTVSAAQETWPKVFQIQDSSGTVIGNVTAKNYNDISAYATMAGVVDGQNATIAIEAKLSTIPYSNLRMDISFETPDATKLPDVLHTDKILTQINITRCSGWSIQDGSFHVTVSMPGSATKGLSADERYYFIRMDGQSVQLLKANVAGPDNDSMITYGVISPDEYLSPTSISTFELAAMLPASATPTPTPTPVPTPTPTPTPEPSGLGISTFTLLIMVFIPAVIAGMIIVYYEMLRKK